MKLFYPVILVLAFTSCTIQKRTVNRGYFVQWHFKPKAGKLPVVDDTVHVAAVPREETMEIAPGKFLVERQADQLPGNSPENQSYSEQGLTVKPTLLPAFQPSVEKKASLLPVLRKISRKYPNPTEVPDYSTQSYIFRAALNIILAGLGVIVLFFLTLAFAQGMLYITAIIFLLILCHICISAIFKFVMFNKMAKLKQQDPKNTTEIEKCQRKINRVRLILNLVFLALYIASFIGLYPYIF